MFYYGAMPVLVLKISVQLLLAAVFAVAAVAKFRSRAKTAEMLEAFGVPVRMTQAGSILMPAAELAAGLGLLVPALAWPAAAGAALMLVAFTIVVGINLALGRHLDCNCFGQTKSAPIGWRTLVRNAALTALAVFIVWARPAFPAPPGIGAFVERAAWLGLALCVAAALVAALATAVVRTYRAIRRRRRSLNASAVLAAFAQRAGLAVRPASAGLPVGTMAPDFALPTAGGLTITLPKILRMKLPVLLIFVSPGCPACEVLSLEAEAWSHGTKHTLMIVLVHEGRALRIRSPQRELYQQKREVADAYRSWGHPEAVLIRPDGTIGAPLLKGLPAIRSVVVEHLRGGSDASETATQPPVREGLALGAEPPVVTLKDQHGRSLTLQDFHGRELLLIFWSPTCSYCRVLLDTLKTWEVSPPPWAPALLLLRTDSEGPDAAPTGLKLPVAFDTDKVMADAFGLIGTPSGVLIDAAGRVASPLAGGVDAIMALANGVAPVATPQRQKAP